MSLPTPRNLITPTDVLVPRPAPSAPRVTSTIHARETTIVAGQRRIDVAVASSCGTRHDVNEDAHSSLDRSAPVFVVADGVGGGALASRVSQELVARLHGQLDHAQIDRDALCDALLDADREIARALASHTEASGAATVALCVGVDASLSQWLLAWVGDCRAYRVPAAASEAAELLSRDDTYRNLGEPPPCGGSLDDPARMVGNGAVDAPNVRTVELRDGEMLMLCSDGAHKHASAADIARILRHREPLARRCARLVESARADGSHDDATVLVVRRGTRDLSGVARMLIVAGAAALLTGAAGWLMTGYSAADASAPRAASQSVSPSTP